MGTHLANPPALATVVVVVVVPDENPPAHPQVPVEPRVPQPAAVALHRDLHRPARSSPVAPPRVRLDLEIRRVGVRPYDLEPPPADTNVGIVPRSHGERHERRPVPSEVVPPPRFERPADAVAVADAAVVPPLDEALPLQGRDGVLHGVEGIRRGVDEVHHVPREREVLVAVRRERRR